MFELLTNYQLVLFVLLTVIFVVGIVLLAVNYVKTKRLEGVRNDVYELFLKAEHIWNESGTGEKRMKWVVQRARSLLPSWLRYIISEEMLGKIIQFWFDGIKDLLDDGKLNKSIGETK
jgi:hypothetical protein